MKKIYFVIIILLGVGLTGCNRLQGKKDYQNINYDGSSEKTEIILTFTGGDMAWNKTMDTVVRGFHKIYPDITVSCSNGTSGLGLYNDFLKKQDAVGELGDIVEISDAKQFATNGRIVPLPKELTALTKYNYSYDGSIYAIATKITTQGIVYNKKIFRQLGLSEPKTYSEFLALCDTIKKYRLIPIAAGGKDLWHMAFWINHFFRQDVLFHNPGWLEEKNEGRVAWVDKEPGNMLKHIAELFQTGYVQSDFMQVSDSLAISEIANGQAVMLYSGPWVFDQLLNLNPDMEPGWFFLPDESGNSMVFDDTSSGWSITAECKEDKKKYEAAVLFLKYFYSEPVYTNVCQTMNSMPAVQEEIEYSMVPIQKKVLEDFEASQHTTAIQIGDEETPEVFRNYMYRLVQELIAGKYEVKEVQQLLDEKWDEKTDED
ncbi:MAG: msmE 19 [Herbinix sp.]|nr:msmE 19 [Herbinix sp.]MDF2870041.1 msmE 19 [Anaerocolumna sp.]